MRNQMLRVGIALLFMVPVSAVAADMNVCKPYARIATDAVIREVWTRAYTHCLNMEEDNPVPPDNWDSLLRVIEPKSPLPPTRPVKSDEPPPGSVPATGPDEAPVVAPPSPASHPRHPVKVKVASGQPQPLCTSHGKRTVYNGLHWRCVR
jgi:hypothetical protein